MNPNTDTETVDPNVLALLGAAAMVDEALPAAWHRLAAYLDAYGDATGVLGRRKTGGDGPVAELRVEDLLIIETALETLLSATTGPDQPDTDSMTAAELKTRLDRLAVMLDEVLKHVTAQPSNMLYESRLTGEQAEEVKARWMAAQMGPAALQPGPARPAVAYTADLVFFWSDHVAMVRRRNQPYAGHYALPGGHVENGETSLQAAIREAGEEIGLGLNPSKFIQVPKVFDAPARDPRGRVVSVAWTARSSATASDPRPALLAGDDAAAALWVPVRDVIRAGVLPVAFDHRAIVMAALDALGTAAMLAPHGGDQ